MTFLSATGWVYLFMGFSTGLVVLIISASSLVITGELYFDWTTVFWGGGLVLFSIIGHLCVSDLLKIDRELRTSHTDSRFLEEEFADNEIQAEKA